MLSRTYIDRLPRSLRIHFGAFCFSRCPRHGGDFSLKRYRYRKIFQLSFENKYD
ncbi:unnamed protein product, partial [Amoebophrya sp. A120]|eukprot:GSA120T00021541001.1